MNGALGGRTNWKTAFCGKADAYAKARPGYPEAAYDYIETLLPPGPVVADVGAGTGKFTVPMARRGWKVYAVEPNSDMLRLLAEVLAPYPNARAVCGAAESTGVPDGSVDMVTCAQAMHWFDPEGFRRECRRILKPGGVIMVVYNVTTSDIGGRRVMIDLSDFFDTPEVRVFPNAAAYDREGWLAFVLSRSSSPRPCEPDYEDFIAEQNAVFDRESREGILRLELMTYVASERI